MSNYDNNMRGLISKNDRKTEDKHPDIKGQCEIDGTEYWISGWMKEKKDGSGKFYSLVFQTKTAKPESRPEPQDTFADLKDDIPFN
jgi:hypothetical protein